MINNAVRLLNRALIATPTRFNAATSATGAVTQTTGVGLSDITAQGTNTALVDHTYAVKISSTGAPDHLTYSIDGGAFGNDAAITGAAQALTNGVTVTFAATTGHTLNNVWTFTVTAGTKITCTTLANVQINTAGSGATVKVYNGSDSTGALLYSNAALAVTTAPLVFGYTVANLYVVVFASVTYPDVIVGTT